MRKKEIAIGLAVIMVVTIFAVTVPISVGQSSSGGTRGGRGGYNILVTEQKSPFSEVNEYDSSGNLVWQYIGPNRVFPFDAERLDNGNTLIANSFQDLIIEVDPSGNTVWSYNTPIFSIPMDAERLDNGNTLYVSTFGGMMMAMGAYEVDTSGNTVWSCNAWTPWDAERLANGNTLITEMALNRVIEVDSSGTIVWQYAIGLNAPQDAERLANGNTLITNFYGNSVIEVAPAGNIVWQMTGLNSPADAERLDNGNTLILDYGNRRVIEVDSSGAIVWQMTGLISPMDVEIIGGAIEATIDIDPDTLNLKSQGKWITGYIEFPQGYDVKDIDASTILLNDAIPSILDTKYGFVKSEDSYIMDHDENGVPERMVKFDRLAVGDMIGAPGDPIDLEVTGKITDGTDFEGSDTIRAIQPP